MKTADRDLDAGLAKPGRQIHRARELVRLHTDQANEPGIGTPDPPDDPADRDHRVAFVIGPDLDRDLRPERTAVRQILRDAVEASERIRRDPRFPPLDQIAVVVVMRLLDQLDDEPAVPQRTRAPTAPRQGHNTPGAASRKGAAILRRLLLLSVCDSLFQSDPRRGLPRTA